LNFECGRGFLHPSGGLREKIGLQLIRAVTFVERGTNCRLHQRTIGLNLHQALNSYSVQRSFYLKFTVGINLAENLSLHNRYLNVLFDRKIQAPIY
jgi:hypothetical protein